MVRNERRDAAQLNEFTVPARQQNRHDTIVQLPAFYTADILRAGSTCHLAMLDMPFRVAQVIADATRGE